MIAFKKLQLVKKLITQVVVYCTIPVSKRHYELIATDLTKQQALNDDPKAI